MVTKRIGDFYVVKATGLRLWLVDGFPDFWMSGYIMQVPIKRVFLYNPFRHVLWLS